MREAGALTCCGDREERPTNLALESWGWLGKGDDTLKRVQRDLPSGACRLQQIAFS